MGEKREAYIAKLKAKLDDWNSEIDKLEAKVGKLNAESRAQYQNQLENLRSKRNDIDQKINDLKKSGESAWTDLKGGIESARKAMDEALKSAVTRFK